MPLREPGILLLGSTNWNGACASGCSEPTAPEEGRAPTQLRDALFSHIDDLANYGLGDALLQSPTRLVEPVHHPRIEQPLTALPADIRPHAKGGNPSPRSVGQISALFGATLPLDQP